MVVQEILPYHTSSGSGSRQQNHQPHNVEANNFIADCLKLKKSGGARSLVAPVPVASGTAQLLRLIDLDTPYSAVLRDCCHVHQVCLTLSGHIQATGM